MIAVVSREGAFGGSFSSAVAREACVANEVTHRTQSENCQIDIQHMQLYVRTAAFPLYYIVLCAFSATSTQQQQHQSVTRRWGNFLWCVSYAQRAPRISQVCNEPFHTIHFAHLRISATGLARRCGKDVIKFTHLGAQSHHSWRCKHIWWGTRICSLNNY